MAEAMRPSLINDFDQPSQRTADIIVDAIADVPIRPVDPAVAVPVVTGLVNAAATLHHWVHDIDDASAE